MDKLIKEQLQDQHSY